MFLDPKEQVVEGVHEFIGHQALCGRIMVAWKSGSFFWKRV